MKFILPKASLGLNERLVAVEKARNALTSLDGRCWEVTIEEKKEGRSLSQNRMLWALYGDILKAAGDALGGFDKDDLHEYCLGEFSGWETVEALGRKRLKPLHRSSKMDKKTFTEFVDFIVRRMGEHGISL